MKHQLWVSHGDKGGVGKSMVSNVLVELLRLSGKKVLLVDGEPENGDVAKRYTGIPGVKTILIDLGTAELFEESINKLAGEIEKSLSEKIECTVVNLPAGASQCIDKDVKSLREIVEALDIEVFTLINVGDSEFSGRKAKEIADSGLGQLGKSVFFIQEFIRGDKEHITKSLKEDGKNNDKNKIEVPVYEFPKLDSMSVSRLLEEYEKPIAHFMDAACGMSFIMRIRYSRFLAAAAEIMKQIDPEFMIPDLRLYKVD